MTDQVDLFGHPAAPPKPAPRRRPAGPLLQRANATQQRQPCGPCLVEQHARARAGEPWGWRRRVTTAVTYPGGEVRLLCAGHLADWTAGRLAQVRAGGRGA